MRRGMKKATEAAVKAIAAMSQKVDGKNHIAKSCKQSPLAMRQ